MNEQTRDTGKHRVITRKFLCEKYFRHFRAFYMDESRERKNYHSEYNEHMNGIAFHNQDACFLCANINIHHAQRTTSGAKAFEEKSMFFFCGNRQKESQAN